MANILARHLVLNNLLKLLPGVELVSSEVDGIPRRRKNLGKQEQKQEQEQEQER